MEIGIVQMMADFVQEGSQECPKSNRLLPFCRSHPYLNRVVFAAAAVLRIESVQLSTAV